ncbi:MAG: hypothetical protein ACRD1D_09195 [Acidimicrobiales bacterium]
MTEHADLDALSAFMDGEAPEWASHVDACPQCRAMVDQLRAVARAVGAPVEPAPAGAQEAAVAAALADGHRRSAAGPAPVSPLARRRPDRRWNVVASVAAVLLVGVLGLSALVTLSTGSRDRTTAAGPAPESAPADRSFAGGSAADSSSSAAAAVPPTDLGDIADVATLRARALPGASVATGQASGGAGGTAGSATGSRSAAPSSPALSEQAPAPTAVGTRPCEEQARGREPALGQVVFYATARHRGAPAVVLGFSSGPSPAPVTLLLLAQDGCAELLRTVAGP